MERTPYFCASAPCSSVSTVMRSIGRPEPVLVSVSLASLWRMGESVLQGPHQLCIIHQSHHQFVCDRGCQRRTRHKSRPALRARLFWWQLSPSQGSVYKSIKKHSKRSGKKIDVRNPDARLRLRRGSVQACILKLRKCVQKGWKV